MGDSQEGQEELVRPPTTTLNNLLTSSSFYKHALPFILEKLENAWK